MDRKIKEAVLPSEPDVEFKKDGTCRVVVINNHGKCMVLAGVINEATTAENEFASDCWLFNQCSNTQPAKPFHYSPSDYQLLHLAASSGSLYGVADWPNCGKGCVLSILADGAGGKRAYPLCVVVKCAGLEVVKTGSRSVVDISSVNQATKAGRPPR